MISKSSEEKASTASSEELVHTPVSLFFQLRNMLIENNILHGILKDKLPNPGDLVEFEATLKKPYRRNNRWFFGNDGYGDCV